MIRAAAAAVAASAAAAASFNSADSINFFDQAGNTWLVAVGMLHLYRHICFCL